MKNDTRTFCYRNILSDKFPCDVQGKLPLYLNLFQAYLSILVLHVGTRYYDISEVANIFMPIIFYSDVSKRLFENKTIS